ASSRRPHPGASRGHRSRSTLPDGPGPPGPPGRRRSYLDDLLLLERVLRGDEHDPEEQEDRELGRGRRGTQEAGPRKGPEEEEHGRDIEDDENQGEHVVLKVKLDLRHPFRHLAALVRAVLQRRRMVRSEEARGEEGAQREQQGDEGKNDDGHVALERHLVCGKKVSLLNLSL